MSSTFIWHIDLCTGWVSNSLSCSAELSSSLSSLCAIICWSSVASCLPKIVRLALTLRFLCSKDAHDVNSVAMVFALGWLWIDFTLDLMFFPVSFLCFNAISNSLSSEISSSLSLVRCFILLYNVASSRVRCLLSPSWSSPRRSMLTQNKITENQVNLTKSKAISVCRLRSITIKYLTTPDVTADE